MNRRPAVIADVDGTLCDVGSVRHHVIRHPEDERPKDFDAFHQSSADCPPHQLALDWVTDQANAGHVILVVTGRMQKHLDVTRRWLISNMPVPFEGPFHRQDDDRRSDVVVKREIYRYLSRSYDIRAAIDDNPSIIALWEELGIPVTVVPGWDVLETA